MGVEMNEFEKKAETFRILIEQLGYTRIMTGRWIEELQDDGNGFPTVIYTCPICGMKTEHNTSYCSHCGARLGEE